MKVLCSECEVAEAKLICCTDDCVLCRACDEKIHAANKVDGEEHKRVALSAPSSPKCDICQEAVAYFLCPQDRALLCQYCDASIHLVKDLASAHPRFLIPGVRVDYWSAELISSTSTLDKADPVTISTTPNTLRLNSTTIMPRSIFTKSGELSAAVVPVSEACSAETGSWSRYKFLGSRDLMAYGSAKAGAQKLANLFPESSRMVPEFTCPPGASGLHFPAIPRDGESSVSEIFFSPISKNSQYIHFRPKRRRKTQC